MPVAQRTLADRFARGETTGTASNMRIHEDGDWTLLVGYGHAVYAARSPDGRIYVFDGWAMRKTRRWAGSQSTKGQMSQLRHIADVKIAYDMADTAAERSYKDSADVVSDLIDVAAPKTRSFDDEAIEEIDPTLMLA